MTHRFAHLIGFSRPVAAAATAPRRLARSVVTAPPRRSGRVGAPAPVSEPRRGRFSHLAGADFAGGGVAENSYTAPLSDRRIQEMWSAAFQNVGVNMNAGKAASSRRPARNRTEAMWEQAIAKVGLLKASF
jgi:hypothetical protein